MPDRRFERVCEIEPPTRPDLTRVRHQIGVLSPVADSFLTPDNHIGRATVSSVAVAHEVQAMGARGIACLNSRDRKPARFPPGPADGRRPGDSRLCRGDGAGQRGRGSQPGGHHSPTNWSPTSNVTAMPEWTRRASRSWPSATAGVFDGVHLVPVSRYREVAARLERDL